MTRSSVLLAALLLFPSLTVTAAETKPGDPLWDGFSEPPQSVRPFVRWWWNGDKLEKGEILRELDVMKAAGIGGVEINPIKFPASNDPLKIRSLNWLSPEWCDMVKCATEGTKDRGMTADLIVGSGWPFGGRFLPLEHQTKILSVGRRKLSGPSKVVITEAEMFAGADLTLHSKNKAMVQAVKFVRLTPAALDRFDPGTDLTGQFTDGKLTVEVPAGEFILHYFVLQEGFQVVINGAPGSDGPVLNHFIRAATEYYLKHMSDGMQPHLGKLGDHFRAFFCDSLELEGANWNDDLLAEFKHRRGYDLLPWLPYLLQKTGQMGNAVEGGEEIKAGPELKDEIQRVRYDYWLTLIDLFRERFLEPFNAWCHEQGVQSRAQAYGHNLDPLESSMLVDIPECETWLNPDTGTPRQPGADTMVNKFVSSAARLAGKKLVSCEEITDTSTVFFSTLEMIKIAGDESNLSGVTHSILHGFNYSPPEAGFPGWVRYGSYFNEQNPWWPYVRHWMDYKARLSWLLQQSEPQANIAILHPLADLWKQDGMQRDPFPKKTRPAYAHELWRALHRNGHNCDYTSENILVRSTMRDGAAVFNERRYETLILMEVDTLRPDTAKALADFANAGGRIIIIGRAPSMAPGLMAKGAQDQEVSTAMRRVLADHPDTCHVVAAPAKGEDLLTWFQRVREKSGLVPDVAFEAASQEVSQTFHKAGDRDVFFVVNSSREKAATVKARFRTNGLAPWAWDPETGTRRLLAWDDTPNALTLRLEPAESRVIVFEKAAEKAPAHGAIPSDAGALEIAGQWTVNLRHMNGFQREAPLTALGDLGKLDGLASFGGQAVY
jgi:hypothetical protein